MEMVAGIDRFLVRATEQAPAARAKTRPDREQLRRLIGASEKRLPVESASLVSTLAESAIVASNASYRILAVKWPVHPGVHGEGLLLSPRRTVRARVIVMPDSQQTPEQWAGLLPGLPVEAQVARRLVENGIEVVVPAVIDRGDAWSGNRELGKLTNQSHREWLHRQLFPVGRTVTGIEVDKALAAADWFSSIAPAAPLGIFGYGEGGRIALLAGALDERFASVWVSGAFGPSEDVWRQPIDRTVWGQLSAYGDAEIASLIAPRALVVEAAAIPAWQNSAERQQDGIARRGAAPGRLETPSAAAVEAEFARAQRLAPKASFTLVSQPELGRPDSYRAFLQGLQITSSLLIPGLAPKEERTGFNPDVRLREQFDEMVEHAQRLVRESPVRRREFADKKTPEQLRKYLWEEVLGKVTAPMLPLKAETRKAYDKPAFTGYEVVLPVWQDVFAYGVLLVPKDLKPGEKRPVVVTQHGLNGRPQDLVEPKDDTAARVYARYAAQLVEKGYIVYAPQNPYIGNETFRILLRKASPLKLSLFSFIIGQHQRTLEWLSSLSFVDERRIGFYGLSYGGKTAMRVPSLLTNYALSICSGDFNEWIWKITSITEPFSYMFTPEYDMLEWNLANTFNYAEMAALIQPRPFMVERGHRDPVGIDEWVAYEYAKVRRAYAAAGLADRTDIEFFDGAHQIHGKGTFEFLARHLRWPPK